MEKRILIGVALLLAWLAAAAAAGEPTVAPKPESAAAPNPGPTAARKAEPATAPKADAAATAKPEPTAAAKPGAAVTAKPEPTAAAKPGAAAAVKPEPETAPSPDSCQSDDECCCDLDCRTDCCPLWTVAADAIFLRRSAQAQTLLTDLAGAELLNATDLTFVDRMGVRFEAIRHLQQSDLDIDVVYFGVDGWDSRAFNGGLAVLQADRFGGPLVSTAAFTYKSQLHSTEINLCQRVTPWLTPLAGFRWVEEHDLYEVTGATFATPYTYTSNADNHLYGFQMGAKILFFERPEGRLRVDGLVKGGIYANAADDSVVFNNAGGPFGVLTASDKRDHAAFVGDIGLNLAYRLSESVALRAGYQLLFLQGVALAPNQIPTTDLIGGGPSFTNPFCGVFYHGVQMGLEVTW